jgi:hypothetical protein
VLYLKPDTTRKGNGMTLEELLNEITSSEPEDWHTIGCFGSGAGPSYRNKLTFFNVYEGQPNILFSDSHTTVAVYKPNLSITMAWGLECSKEFKEEWATKFPDPSASVDFVDIFYNSALVYRDYYVVVDGGRAYLPMPNYPNDLSVPRRYSAFIKLIDRLVGRTSDYDRFFNQAGLKIVDSEWPRR